MKTVLYTAIIGPAGDRLQPLSFQLSAGDRAVAFLDRDARARLPSRKNDWQGWELRDPPVSGLSPRRQARRLKTQPHLLFPDADVSLWLDGCLSSRAPVSTMALRFLTNDLDLAVFQHTDRSSIYQEAEACIRMRKDSAQVIMEQIARYRQAGYPDGLGLAETTAVLRRHSNRMAEFNCRWWREIEHGSVRDQLSFDYVCWLLGVRYRHLPGSRTDSPLFVWRPHSFQKSRLIRKRH